MNWATEELQTAEASASVLPRFGNVTPCPKSDSLNGSKEQYVTQLPLQRKELFSTRRGCKIFVVIATACGSSSFFVIVVGSGLG